MRSINRRQNVAFMRKQRPARPARPVPLPVHTPPGSRRKKTR